MIMTSSLIERLCLLGDVASRMINSESPSPAATIVPYTSSSKTIRVNAYIERVHIRIDVQNELVVRLIEIKRLAHYPNISWKQSSQMPEISNSRSLRVRLGNALLDMFQCTQAFKV